MNADTFLEMDVLASSPARLRLLLIQKACGLCDVIQQAWQSQKIAEAASWLLRLNDILSELLSGVTDKNNPAAKSISDLYVYMSQLLNRVEQSRSDEELVNLKSILQIELDTWRLFVLQETQAVGIAASHQSASQYEDLVEVGSFDLQF